MLSRWLEPSEIAKPQIPHFQVQPLHFGSVAPTSPQPPPRVLPLRRISHERAVYGSPF